MNKDRKKYNRNWLVEILNLFKNAEYGEKDAYPITTEQIYTYCNPFMYIFVPILSLANIYFTYESSTIS